MKWRLNKVQYPVYNLGEGKRIGIWVQGCNLKCKGCVNKVLWSKRGGKGVEIIDIFNFLVSFHNEYDGITITGGEPFQQYEQLISFLYLVKLKTQLNTLCFTGYYLDELLINHSDNLFLKYIDILIDGRYIDNSNMGENNKGSSNQTIYRIINDKPIKLEGYQSSNKWSVHISVDNTVYMAGIPKSNELSHLSNTLLEKGINKKFI